ncbi:glycoside hydrolase family 6 protein [Nonomuraea basaltis]|uniref:glycoside hydrolase family 6 protein n=1 Tax=Nonomuraea basaltis TaxID=2495887 RepID=UPI0014871B62|nr:glycoside hydrolase family 6 protein [Nonomuraea basaltis]
MTLEALRDGDPRRVGPYTLLGRLGEGGMGVVFLGQGPDGARVAVKLIHARLDADAGFRRRFAREVAAAKRVARFCTAPVLDADVEGDVAYLVTEYVEGPSLGEVVSESGPLKGSALDGLAASMAMALRAIHGAGVVHRDLKPSNVLLSQVGPKVIDFGIAQLADAEMSSAIVGTPAYMSPEQVSGSPIGPASDIFSWGCTVAFAAGGLPPFGSGSVPTILLRIVNEPPDLRGLSGPLRDLVLAALAKNPAERPTAQALMDHLSTANASLPMPPPPPGAHPPDSSPQSASVPGARRTGDAPAGGASGHADATQPSSVLAAGTAPGAGVPPASAPSIGAPGTSAAGANVPSTGAGAGGAGAAGVAEGGAAGRRRRLLAAAAALVVAMAGVSVALVWRGQDPAGVRNPAAQDATGGGTAQDGTGDGASATASRANRPATQPATSAQNPLRAQESVRFYSPDEPAASRQAALWAADRPKDAELMSKLAKVPHAIRLNEPEVRSKVDNTITAAEEAGGVPVFLINYMPGSDCQPTGASDMVAYQDWIKGIADQIDDAKTVIILEPSSLVKLPGTKDCDLQGSPDQRYKDLREAVQTLKGNPNTAVYLDGSLDLYPGAEILSERLIASGIERADGFFVNATGHQSTEKSVAYGKKLSACIGVQLETGRKGCPTDVKVDSARMPHFVVDTSRNGRGAWTTAKPYPDPQTWCNPPGRGLGARPTTVTGEELVDAYLWIARAGSSSGRCRRGTDGEKDPERGVVSPEAGEWWDVLALERAKLADPPLR